METTNNNLFSIQVCIYKSIDSERTLFKLQGKYLDNFIIWLGIGIISILIIYMIWPPLIVINIFIVLYMYHKLKNKQEKYGLKGFEKFINWQSADKKMKYICLITPKSIRLSNLIKNNKHFIIS